MNAQPAQVREGEFEGMRWRFAAGGGPSCLVFVNGVGMDKGLWLPVYAQGMQAAGHSVLTFNHRKIRDPADVQSLSVQDLVEQTAALLRHLDIRRPVLVGTSLGAFISQELALKIEVAALVLLGTYGAPGPLQRHLIEAEAEIYASGAEVPEAYMVAMDLLQGCSRKQLLDDANFDKLFMGFQASTDYSDLSRQATFFAARTYGPGTEHLRGIRCPALVVGFEEDLLTPRHLCQAVANAIPDAQFQELAGAAHFGALTQARDIVARITEFLGRRGLLSTTS